MSVMTKDRRLILLVLGCVSLLALGLGPGSGKKKRTTYEYCSLVILTIEDQSGFAYQPPKGSFVKANDLASLCAKMGVRGESSVQRFMNHLGSDGWQFVWLNTKVGDPEIPDSMTEVYYFKRVKR